MATPKDAIKKLYTPWSPLKAEAIAFMGASSWSFEAFKHNTDWPQENDYNDCWIKLKDLGRHPDISFKEQQALGQRTLRKLKSRLRQENKTLVDIYTESIVLDHQVPTRIHNWHDFFNFNIWLSFPKSKSLLHQSFYRSRIESRKRKQILRSPKEDLLTSLDEGGALFACLTDDYLKVTSLLKSRIIENKASLLSKFQTELTVFGHGVVESVLAGENKLNLMTLPICVESEFFKYSKKEQTEVLDDKLATIINKDCLDCAGSFPLDLICH